MNVINLARYKKVKEATKDCSNEELKKFNEPFSLSKWLYCLDEYHENLLKNDFLIIKN